MEARELPLKIKIASPCHARWEDMSGNEQVRFCDHCRKNVYNLSAMTTTEATDLLKAKHGNLCARIYQRADGTVLTEDCPVGIEKYWRHVKTFVAATVTIMTLAAVNAWAASRQKNLPPNRPFIRAMAAVNNAKDKVQAWAGLQPKPPPLMGDICIAAPPQKSPPPKMGEIAAVPTVKK